MEKIVIIGAGVAGVNAATKLVDNGYPGDLNLGDSSDPQYAQNDDHLRAMEKEAYLEGNMLMRDFEDNFKYQQ